MIVKRYKSKDPLATNTSRSIITSLLFAMFKICMSLNFKLDNPMILHIIDHAISYARLRPFLSPVCGPSVLPARSPPTGIYKWLTFQRVHITFAPWLPGQRVVRAATPVAGLPKSHTNYFLARIFLVAKYNADYY
jgi:hypothetical protein